MKLNKKIKINKSIGQVVITALLVSLVLFAYDSASIPKAHAILPVIFQTARTTCSSSSSVTCTLSYSSNVNIGDVLIITSGVSCSIVPTGCMGWPDGCTLTDTQSNTWTNQSQFLTNFANSNNFGECMGYTTASSTGADTVTVKYPNCDLNSVTCNIQIIIFDVLQIQKTGAVVTAERQDATPQTSTFTPNNNFASNSFLISTSAVGASNIYTAGSGFTLYEGGSQLNDVQFSYTNIVSSPTTFPMTSLSSDLWVAAGISFPSIQSTTTTTTTSTTTTTLTTGTQTSTTTISATASTSCAGALNCDDKNSSVTNYVGQSIIWYAASQNGNFAGTIRNLTMEIAAVKISTTSTWMQMFIGLLTNPVNGNPSFQNPYLLEFTVTSNPITNGSTNVILSYNVNIPIQPNQRFIIGFMAVSTACRCSGATGTSGISVYEINTGRGWTYLNNAGSETLPQTIYTGIAPNPQSFYEWANILYPIVIVTSSIFNSTLTLTNTITSSITTTQTVANLQGENAGLTVTNLITYLPFWIFPLLFGAIGAATGLGAQGLIFGFIIGGFMGYELGLFPIWMIFILVVVLYLMIRR